MAGSPSKPTNYIIKIKSPKSDFKLHKYNYVMPKVPPDLTIRGNTSSQNLNDDVDKITQAWNRLKINALSKAIAMSPDVGPCSFKPTSYSLVTEVTKEDFESCSENLDLSNAISSTPMKPKKEQTSWNDMTRADETGDYPWNVSEIKPDPSETKESFRNIKEMTEIEALRVQCLQQMEYQIVKCCQQKREERLNKWIENEEKIKEKMAAFKVELEREQLLRVQEEYLEVQKLMQENAIDSQLRTDQLLKTQFNHEKKLAETSEKIRQIEEKRKELEEKQKQKREELKMCITGIHEMQLAYNKKYNHISEITKKCKDRRRLNELVLEDLPKLKKMNELLLKLVEKCKEGKVNTQDLKTAEILTQEISVISDIFARKTEQVNSEIAKAEEEKKNELQENELKARKEQLERQQKSDEEANKQQQQLTGNEKQPSQQKTEEPRATLRIALEDCVSREDLKWHLELAKFLAEYENMLKPLIEDDSLKNFRFECQKAVNLPVNAISPLDDLHLEDKLYKLSRLLQGQAVPQGSNLFFVTGHPLGVAFCTNLLAKKFIKQGEITVSSKPEAAFAIAAVIVALWHQFPEFGRLLLAHFHRDCPYLIPMFKPQVEGQSDQDYYKMLGYQYSEDGKVEPQDKFLLRMKGVTRLYAAILVTPLRRSLVAEGQKHPHDIREGWKWLAATLNLSPRIDICPTMMYDFLDVAGYKMYHTYGSQFGKLLHLLCVEYFPRLEQVTPESCSGPVVRLKQFLEKILKEGQIAPPTGLLPPNFW